MRSEEECCFRQGWSGRSSLWGGANFKQNPDWSLGAGQGLCGRRKSLLEETANANTLIWVYAWVFKKDQGNQCGRRRDSNGGGRQWDNHIVLCGPGYGKDLNAFISFSGILEVERYDPNF